MQMHECVRTGLLSYYRQTSYRDVYQTTIILVSIVHLVCFSFLQTDIAENLFIFWLLLSLHCFLCLFLFISHIPSFPHWLFSYFCSFFFLLFSFQHHFFLCSDSLFITREIWKKNGRGVFPLPHQRRLADIVSHLSKGQNWAPEMHTLTMSALLFFCYYMMLHYSFLLPGSLGVKIWLSLSC